MSPSAKACTSPPLAPTTRRRRSTSFAPAGFGASDLVTHSRPATLPDGSIVEVAFDVIYLDEETMAPLHVSVCGHRNPEHIFLAELSRHANTAVALKEILVVTADPAAAAARCAALFGAAPRATKRRLERRRSERLDRLHRFVTGSRPSVGATRARCPRIGLLRGGESRRGRSRAAAKRRCKPTHRLEAARPERRCRRLRRSNSSNASRRDSSPVQRGVHTAGAPMQPIAAARPLTPSGRTRRARSRRDR